MKSKEIKTFPGPPLSCSSEPWWTVQLRTTPSPQEVASVDSLKSNCWHKHSSQLFLSRVSLSSPVLWVTNTLRKLSKFSQKSSLQALLITSKRCHSLPRGCKLPSWTYGAPHISPSWRTTQLSSATSAKHPRFQPKLSNLLQALVGQPKHFHNRPRQAPLRQKKLRHQRLPPETIWKYCWTPSPSFEQPNSLSLTFKFENSFPTLIRARL